ncbi:hypothetical protein MELA_02344 [Candidatus Methylomirabilis lanthanidiphila]|uniref:Uncharacterized protein n=1 Tax=Candidatus Methylomirabilis lanthanidiphila TaxID=2211376 RepID=A0A564ZKT7_9BACT|nr:helix-turn-helix domain-containing protein [Candidatus Methylomirabilis lanthanidiphila]VUZ85950.1 hypothetical protein MELA_02344 [Candidatus Methylomirabilis lanthanidiphila]
METNSDNPLLTKILTRQEIRLVARRIKAMLPAEIFQFSRSRGRSVEDTLRIGSLSKRCQIEREKLRLTVKQAAEQLRVPQYHLRACDEGDLSEIRQDVLGEYLVLLGLQDWVQEWIAANPGLARRLGLNERPVNRTRRTAITSETSKRSRTTVPRADAAVRKTNPLRTRRSG